MTKRTLTAMLLATTLTACLTSPPSLKVARADRQFGTFGSVYMSDSTVHSGELLAVDDSSIVLLTQYRVAIGSLSRIDRLSFDDFETRDVGATRRLSAATLRKGKEASRFPYGITAAAMARLLENTKQTAPARLEGRVPQ